MPKNIFIGAAWPYANGSLHLGHISAFLGADILARYHRLVGNKVLFVSGTDCHGTPIALEARKQGLSASELAEKYHKEFIETLINDLNFSYDVYTKTTTENHKKNVQEIFLKLYQAGHIYKKIQNLPYCPKCQRFLPDRYLEGTCPHCNFVNARGDQCDECGSLVDPEELLNSKCKICGQTPEWKASEHFFFKLSAFKNHLQAWMKKSKTWRANARNFTLNLIKQDLPDRAITRDIEWGVAIPLDSYKNKRIYVWFEAVCGYLSASKEWDKNQWKKFWINDKALEHFYVHGKDNIPFHTIIWPSILIGYDNLHLPDHIISSEYLTFEKERFSTSRNLAVWAKDFLQFFDSEMLRYYLTIYGPETSDVDFSWKKFQERINNELIATFGNFVHRTFSLIKINFPQGVRFPKKFDEQEKKFIDLLNQTFSSMGEKIEKAEFRQALRFVFCLIEHGNRFLNQASPWTKVKNKQLDEAEKTLAVLAYVIHATAILITPFLPKTGDQILRMLEIDTSKKSWQKPDALKIYKILNLKLLYKKIESATHEVTE